MRRRRRHRSSFDRNEFDIKDFMSEAGQWFISILLVVIFAYSIVTFGVQSITMIGQSMEPSLSNQQILLLNKRAYTFSSPKRYDIVAYKLKNEEDAYYNIKRVVGLPGETIQIKKGRILIDGTVLTDLPFDDLIMTEGLAANEIELGENEYFLIGDNCNNSEDSRYINIGNVTKKEIKGKVFFRILPRTEIGRVK